MSAALATRDDPGKWASAALATLVHGLLALFLFYGVRWQTHTPEVFEVELVRAPIAATRPPPPRPAVEPVPPVTTPEPKVEARPEPKPPPKPDIAIKEKPKPKPEPKPEPKLEPKVKAVEDKLMKEALQRDAARIQASKIDQEMTRVQEARASAARNAAEAAWANQVRAAIKRKLLRPPGVSGNPEAEFEVNLLPDGSLVGDPRLKKSTGNPLLDAAIERAILTADPLPKPADPSVFQRTLRLKFRPLEELPAL